MSGFNGRYQSIRHTLYYKKVLFLWFHLFPFLKNDQFFPEKVTKSCFKKCPISSKLRDFCYSLLKLKFVKFLENDSLSMFITHQNVSILHCFPYYEEGRGIFLWKIELYMDPLFSKFIFPKSSRASAHQFWARSDQPVSRKMTFLLKIDHF